MYQPDAYRKQDKDFIYSFIQKNPFATMVIKGEQLLATHVPLIIKGNPKQFQLYGHIANHNEMIPFLRDGAEVLLIFQGPHAYISSSWYPKKDISTWDYSAVHVNAKIKLQTQEELYDSLSDLVENFEKEQEYPLYMKNYPIDKVKHHIEHITGFSAKPVLVKGIAKHHQKSSEQEVKAVISRLQKNGNVLLAKEIEEEHKL